MPLLSRVERDYLTAGREFNDDYAYTIKSRLAKKLDLFVKEELPIFIEKGYLTEFRKVHGQNLTEFCKVPMGRWSSLVRIQEYMAADNNSERELEKENNSGPKGIRTPDPRHVKAVS